MVFLISKINGKILSLTDKQIYPQLKELKQKATEREKQAYAPGTYRNLELQWACYKNFCAFYHLQLVPALEQNLVLYIKFLEINMKSPKTVYNYLLGVKIMHHWLGLDVKVFSCLRVKHMLRAVFKMSTHIVKQAQPMTPQILIDVRKQLNLSKPDDVTFWAMCLVAFMLMLRKSNLVPDTLSSFDPTKQLTRGHLKFVEGAVWVRIVWSKTLQFYLKDLNYPLLQIKGSDMCPVVALRDMVRMVPLKSSMPCFARVGGAPWTYQQFQHKLRQCLQEAGYAKELFSSHSMRRGGCSFCFQAGVPSELIQVLGDWKTDIYKQYCNLEIETRAQACARFRKELLRLKL